MGEDNKSREPRSDSVVFKLFLASDVHGSNKCFRKFVNASKFYGADVLVLCGDITGKALIFLVDNGNGTYSCDYLGAPVELKNKEQMLAQKKQIDDSGYYSYVCTKKEFEEITHEKRDPLIVELIYQRMKDWVAEADSRLADSSTEVYVLPGNDDPFRIDGAFDGSRRVVNPEGRVLEMREGHEMIATGYVNMTPWRAPRDIEDEDLMKRIRQMADKLARPEDAIFALHAPPFDTNLDLAPHLDETLKPKTVLGQLQFDHVGSKSVRKVIEEYRPLLGLHGHVHESKAFSKVGRTLCFNAGSEYEQGILRGVLIALSPHEIENYYFSAG